jgi:hypothetical protein
MFYRQKMHVSFDLFVIFSGIIGLLAVCIKSTKNTTCSVSILTLTYDAPGRKKEWGVVVKEIDGCPNRAGAYPHQITKLSTIQELLPWDDYPCTKVTTWLGICSTRVGEFTPESGKKYPNPPSVLSVVFVVFCSILVGIGVISLGWGMREKLCVVAGSEPENSYSVL